MKRTLAIAQREWVGLFCSPIAYVVIGLFVVGTAILFVTRFDIGAPATLRPMLSDTVWLLVFIVPAVSMRALSEELRSGTYERLMTAPVSDTAVALGKWLGGMGFIGVMLLPVVFMMGVLELAGDPEPGPMVTGLLGLVMVAGLYLAIGVFSSASTSNQVIALLLTVAIISVPTFALFFVRDAPFVTPGVRKAVDYASVDRQFADFAKGLIDVRNFVYFGSLIALFLFLAVKVLEARRWK
ncbi:MAG: ABC transporter permease [Planctomycetota bacterium]